ncbi:MAG: flagellin [Oxalobacter formigenes]|nr:flagellin [Oxalobacter formigenes]
MPQIINTNMSSLNSQRHLNATENDLATTMERLSSGKRINSARDDAAGLGISERMTSQINGMNQAIRNARDGISLGQTAEGALSTMNDMLQRVRVLAVQASNATNSPADRQALQDEVGQLVSELNRIAEVTTFNGQHLLNGTMGTQYFQIGPNAGETIGANGTNFLTNNYGNYRVQNIAKAPDTTKGAETVKLTGYLGSADLNITDKDSARTIVGKVNNLSGETGITASAQTDALLTCAPGGTFAFQMSSNNADDDPVTISFAIGDDTSLGDTFAAAINAINAQTAKTGVMAEYDSVNQGIKLTNQGGNDIKLTQSITASDAEIHAYDADGKPTGTKKVGDTTPVVSYGVVTLDSPNSFVAENVSGGGAYNLVGTAELMPVSRLDVSTFDKAQEAIVIVDSALVHIVGEMARYGALQARFESTISNLEVTSENTSNSRSRIQDADYAQETANLARATILRQAGTSMLAQANQMPQTVLSLLQ